jgi:hypothetical protein
MGLRRSGLQQMRELTRRQLSRKAARLRVAQEAYYYRHRPIRDIASDLGVTVETVAAYLREPLTLNTGGPNHECTPESLQRLRRRGAVIAATSSNSISDEQSRPPSGGCGFLRRTKRLARPGIRRLLAKQRNSVKRSP